MSFQIYNQSPLSSTHLRIDCIYEGLANGAKQEIGTLTSGFIISTQEMGGWEMGGIQCPFPEAVGGGPIGGGGYVLPGGGTRRRGRRHRVGGGWWLV